MQKLQKPQNTFLFALSKLQVSPLMAYWERYSVSLTSGVAVVLLQKINQSMKKPNNLLIILFLLLFVIKSNGQNLGSLKRITTSTKTINVLNMKLFKMGMVQREKTETAKPHKRMFRPKFSVDLLNNKGIHLFTISDVDFLPTIKVGARVKAGISITI